MYVLAFNVMIVVFVIIGVYMESPWDVHGTYMYYFCNFHVSCTILTVVTFSAPRLHGLPLSPG